MTVAIVGAGTYGQVYCEYLQEAGISPTAFLDDAQNLVGKEVSGIPVLGRIADIGAFAETGRIEIVYCPLGDNELRHKVLATARELGIATPSFVHSSAIVPPSVHVPDGAYVLPGTIVMPFVEIEPDVMISMGARIAHHTKLGQAAFLSTGVNVGAGINIGLSAFVGIGATVMTGVKYVGDGSVIGAGSVVIRDVEEKSTVAGVPARVVGSR